MPEWPVAGEAVASELEKCCLPPESYPALWEWIGRLEKLREQLLPSVADENE